MTQMAFESSCPFPMFVVGIFERPTFSWNPVDNCPAHRKDGRNCNVQFFGIQKLPDAQLEDGIERPRF